MAPQVDLKKPRVHRLVLEPVRLDAAKGLARVKGLMNLPWGNCPGAPTVGYVLAVIETARIVETNKSGVSFMWCSWSESATATALGEKHREISGWHGPLDAMPEELRKSHLKGCPSWFLGVSTANLWKVARFLLWCEVPEMVELDLVVSHHRQMLKLAKTHGIPVPSLESYASSKESVKEMRARKAAEYQVSQSDVKLLFTSVGIYGSSGMNWLEEHDKDQLCPAVSAMKSECAAVAEAVWRAASQETKDFVESRSPPRKMVTLLSMNLARLEREDVDKLSAVIQEQGGESVAWLGDCCYARGYKFSGKTGRVEEAMRGQDILVTSKPLPRGAEEYMQWLQDYMAKKGVFLDKRPCTDRDIAAFTNQAWSLCATN